MAWAMAVRVAAPLPRFDKSADDRAPREAWPLAPEATQVLLLEGWCVGARPQPDVPHPVNALEAQEDPSGLWRRHANAALAGEYQHLFARIGLLVLLAAPGWEVVARWREQQEAELRAKGGAAVMNLMCQLQANQLGVSVSRPTVLETTAMGAAYLAGLATGVWASTDDIVEAWTLDRTFEPQPTGTEAANHARWLRGVERSLNWQH